MPRKQFEEAPYDPIAADLVREVASAGRVVSPVLPLVPRMASATRPVTPVARPVPEIVPREVSPSPPPQPKSPEPTITKRFILTRSEDEDLNAFLLRLQQRAGTKVTVSVLARAAMSLAMQAEQQLMAEIGEGFIRRLPSTHDSLALGDFEDLWMRCLANAFRKLPRLSLSAGLD